MKPTKKDTITALDNCKKHWKFLIKTGTLDKEEYFVLNDIPMISQNCFMCDLVGYDADHEDACVDCPLVGYAWEEKCFYDNSIYSTWQEYRTSTKDRKKLARRMVEACKLAINDILEK